MGSDIPLQDAANAAKQSASEAQAEQAPKADKEEADQQEEEDDADEELHKVLADRARRRRLSVSVNARRRSLLGGKGDVGGRRGSVQGKG